MFLAVLAPIQIYLKLVLSVAYHLSQRVNTENIYVIFVNPQNNMISDMPVLFK